MQHVKWLRMKCNVLFLILFVFTLFFSGSLAGAQSAGGPIVLMGVDAEDGGVNGHGPITVYHAIVKSILAKVSNGGEGILVIGANSIYVKSFWENISNAVGENVTFVSGATSIRQQSFSGFAMIAVVSDEHNTYGGLTQLEHNELVNRQSDVAAFVNNGGGLLGFSSDFSNPYAYLDLIAKISFSTNLSYDNITPNAEGKSIGITDELDICCWHDEYISFPSFLKVLATSPSGNASAIGGIDIALPSSLYVTPNNVSIAEGQVIPLKVKLTPSDGSPEQDVTLGSTGTTYSSSSSNILVDQDGLISLSSNAVVGETGKITIEHNGLSVTAYVKVDKPVELIELSASQNKLTLGPGESQQLQVSATYSDGTKKDVTYATAGTTYESTSGIVTVSPNGKVTLSPQAQFGETAQVTIKNQDKFVTVQVEVKEPPVQLVVSPSSIVLQPGQKVQIFVTAQFADGTSKDVTQSTVYNSANTALAIVDKNGMVSTSPTAKPGMVTIQAQYAGLSGESQVTIDKTYTGLTVSPNAVSLKPGETQQLQVHVMYSDGTNEDVTADATYKSTNINLATVDTNGLVTVPSSATGGTVNIQVQFAGLTETAAINVPSSKTVTSLLINPTTERIQPGHVKQLQVTANYSDGTSEDITNMATYSSSNSNLGKVDSFGLVTVPDTATTGSFDVTASYSGVNVRSRFTVGIPVVESLSFAPDNITMTQGQTYRLKVVANYSDGTSRDVTYQVSYSSSNTGLASVDGNGVVTIPSTATGGTVYIRGSYEGKGGATTVTVPSPPPLSSLTFTPGTLTLKPGETYQLSVTANFSDGSTKDVTSSTSYSSSNQSLAIVDANGLITIPSTATGGTVYIRGSYDGKGGATTVTIPSSPSVASLTFTPDKLTLKQGETGQFQVTATYVDGSTEDVTAKSGLISSDTVRATVDPATGVVTVLDNATAGTVYIRGSYGGKGGAVTITVPSLPSIVSLTFNPATKTVKPGDTVQIQVTANYSDGTTKDVTNLVSLKSSNTNLATVDSATGLVTISANASNGSVNIQGSYGGKGGAATITVSKPYIVGIAFNPNKVTLKAGDTLAMKVMATYSDGSTEDVTAQTVFSSSNTSIATVDASGVVTIANPTNGGTVYIRGTYSGKGAASTVTVSAPPSVANLRFTPSTATLKNGQTLQLNVIAEYSDGSTEDVTSKVAYSSSNTNMANVNNAGLVTVPANAVPGTVYIRGSYNGKGGAATITIPQKPSLASLSFNPGSLSLNKGDTYQVKVMANYTDGTTEDVTALTTFSSSNTNIATVDAAGLITVPATSVGGTVYIRGTYGGKGGATTITVQ